LAYKYVAGAAALLCAPFAVQAQVQDQRALEYPGDVVGMSNLGVTGGLVTPDGRTLQDKSVLLGYSHAQEPMFSHLRGGHNYLFGIGLLPHVELSGRLANYNLPNGELGVRDLSANLKISLPRIFEHQPDIAFGVTDLGGGAPFFRSRYVVASGTEGAFSASLGYARRGANVQNAEGSDLHGVFAGGQVALWSNGRSGIIVLAERKSQANYYGFRYVYANAEWMRGTRFVLTAQQSARAKTPDGRSFNRPTVSLNLVIPLSRTHVSAAEPVWTPPVERPVMAGPGRSELASPAASSAAPHAPPPAPSPVPLSAPMADQPSALPVHSAEQVSAEPVSTSASLARPGLQAGIATQVRSASHEAAQLARRLTAAGFERVRIGRVGQQLVVELENRRYNWNEADAIGIALGLAARTVAEPHTRLAVIGKKAGLPMYEVSVDRAAFMQFMRDGQTDEVAIGLDFRRAPSVADVDWYDDDESPRGWSRLRVEPSLVKFVATELGVFDYSLAANVQALVPLWKGAELSTSYLSTVGESNDVANGFLGWAQQRDGLRSATLSQAVWLGEHALSVFTAGRMQYDHLGFQNETTVFVPGAEGQVRFQYSRIRHDAGLWKGRVRQHGGVSYAATWRPLDLTVEVGYQR
jgi:hypothetical protein